MATLFLYGTSLPGHPDHRWIVGLRTLPATVRGSLWRGPRNRPMLLVEPTGRPIRGLLVELDDAKLPVLDLVETAGDSPFGRVAIRAVHNMRTVPAEAWAFPPGSKPPRGWRKLATDDWAGIGR